MALALIADDLTGAADSGVQFAKRGFSATLLLDPAKQRPGEEIIIVDTESRADPPAVAYTKAHAIASLLPRTDLVYKKIDSTLRGSFGAELDAIMEALSIDRAVVAPAFPPAGRTTVRGRQLLNGHPLESTAFAQDPISPVTESCIPSLLRRHMRRAVGLLQLPVVRAGPDVLAGAVATSPEQVFVVDAVTEADLSIIARAIQTAGVRLACGSAGLANALAAVMVNGQVSAAESASTGPESDAPVGPVLVIAASRNPVTTAQLCQAAQDAQLALVQIDSSALVAESGSETRRLEAQAQRALSAGRSVALTATQSTFVEDLGATLLHALAEVAAQLTAQNRLAGLVLTGGDTALAVCEALEAHSLSLIGEIAPGIPLARVADGPHWGLRLVTKAGGFGQPSAIAEAIRFLRCCAPSGSTSTENASTSH